MTGGEIAAIIGGISGLLATLFGTWRVARKEHNVAKSDNAAVLLGGWRDFQAETLKEVERVRSSFQAQISEMKAEHETDTARWDRDRDRLQKEIDSLKATITVLLERQARGMS